MFRRSLLISSLAASVALVPATRVAADAGDFIAGAIVGAIVNHAAKNQPRTKVYRQVQRKKVVRPGIPATTSGRQIQTSLNYFGFDAGAVDGQLGNRSRQAISSYQAYLGYPVTGQLSQFEEDFLISSYNRAQAGGHATQTQIAGTRDGVRGLLIAYRTEMAGGAPVAAAGTLAVAAPPAVELPPIAATEVMALTETAPAGALPNLFGGTVAKVSLASHCNAVSLLTNSNGGFTTIDTMADPEMALNEQFCLARTYAIAAGEQLAQGLGASPQQIADHCAAYGTEMRPYVAALSLKDRDSVVREVSSFVLGTGIAMPDLAATAKVCLSVGYRTDSLDEAVGSALILVTLGEKSYGELMGHHLHQGFGVAKRSDLAWEWFDTGLEAATTQAVFAPGQTGRVDLLRRATMTLQPGGQAGATPVAVPQKASTLPSFSVTR